MSNIESWEEEAMEKNKIRHDFKRIASVVKLLVEEVDKLSEDLGLEKIAEGNTEGN